MPANFKGFAKAFGVVRAKPDSTMASTVLQPFSRSINATSAEASSKEVRGTIHQVQLLEVLLLFVGFFDRRESWFAQSFETFCFIFGTFTK